jgi:hypothetical protein
MVQWGLAMPPNPLYLMEKSVIGWGMCLCRPEDSDKQI